MYAFAILVSPFDAAGNKSIGRWKQSGFLSHLVEELHVLGSSGSQKILMSMKKKTLIYKDIDILEPIDHDLVQSNLLNKHLKVTEGT